MRWQANLGPLARIGYVAAGAGMVTLGLFRGETDWLRLGLSAGGALVLIEGLIGY